MIAKTCSQGHTSYSSTEQGKWICPTCGEVIDRVRARYKYLSLVGRCVDCRQPIEDTQYRRCRKCRAKWAMRRKEKRHKEAV
jgi:Zn finger protein HypA/HybF involved in hydrogenase expression